MTNEPVRIVTLCTGNAARSVMMAASLVTLAETQGRAWHLRSAGTHVGGASGVSARTLAALVRLGEVDVAGVRAHRSHQLDEADVRWADVILCAEVSHVNFVRRRFPNAASRTVGFAQLARDASPGQGLVDATEQVARSASDELCDVTDPAGQEQGAYDECADVIWRVSRELIDRCGS